MVATSRALSPKLSLRCRSASTAQLNGRQQSFNRQPIVVAPDDVKENAFTIVDGAIAIRTGGTLTPVANLPDETARRIRGMIKVREAVREVLRTQLDDRGEDEVADARRQLNFLYDQFVSRFGAINESANRRAFRGDPDCPLLCSLEEYDDDTRRATKAAIFQRAHNPAAAARTRRGVTARCARPFAE